MSGYLLDTQVVIATVYNTGALSRDVLSVLADPEVERRVSVVTAFEIAVKHSLGKLPLPRAFGIDFTAAYEEVVDRLAASSLDVRLPHAARVRRLPLHHRDPFDRLLIAQAMEEDLTLVSRDGHFRAYEGLKVLPA